MSKRARTPEHEQRDDFTPKRSHRSSGDGHAGSPSTSSTATASTVDWKIFNDPVHGSIKIHPVLVAIIDTPQFQRLRDVKQLGGSYWVFPGACHNRFEHSIGTSHLCGKLLRALKENHSDIITDKDVLCIEIAGLCHDLGHGPFSHVFDMQYMKLVRQTPWEHEDGSVVMFKHLVEKSSVVQNVFKEYGITDTEKEFVTDLIKGKYPDKDNVAQTCNFDGKETEKWFMYEIVANKRNGIDCDKFDYLMRDCHYIGMKNNFDCTRYFQNTRIMLVDRQLQICVRDKEIFNLYELFHIRWSLHHRVYQHKTIKVVEEMLCEALAKVDKKFNISKSVDDPEEYTNLTDSIIFQILRSKDGSKEVNDAQQILRKIQTRQTYKFCGQVNAFQEDSADSTEQCKKKRMTLFEKEKNKIAEDICDSSDGDENEAIGVNDIVVSKVSISYGMDGHDPMDSVVLYTKDGKAKKSCREQISELLPKSFKDGYIRVYCKNPEKKDAVEKQFTAWSKKNGFFVANELVGDKTGYFTPVHKGSTAKKKQAEDSKSNPEGIKTAARNLFEEGEDQKGGEGDHEEEEEEKD